MKITKSFLIEQLNKLPDAKSCDFNAMRISLHEPKCVDLEYTPQPLTSIQEMLFYRTKDLTDWRLVSIRKHGVCITF